jgi:hypothetical protein
MTVSTVIAGLLPTAWSTSVGAEALARRPGSGRHGVVARPRPGRDARDLPDSRAPAWLRTRGGRPRLRASSHPAGVRSGAVAGLPRHGIHRWRMAPPAQDALAALRGADPDGPREGCRYRPAVGDGALRQGRNRFFVEFRRTGSTAPLDADRAPANMSMPGMAMSSGLSGCRPRARAIHGHGGVRHGGHVAHVGRMGWSGRSRDGELRGGDSDRLANCRSSGRVPPAAAQPGVAGARPTQFIDRVDGLSLADAVGRAPAGNLASRPCARRSTWRRGPPCQAGLRPNPSATSSSGLSPAAPTRRRCSPPS